MDKQEELRRLFPEASMGFVDVVHTLLQLHSRKMADYGPLERSNLTASEALGIPAWLGVLLRMSDKMSRLQKYARDRQLANESFEDSLLDLASYSLLCLLLHRREKSHALKQGSAAELLPADPGTADCQGSPVAAGASRGGLQGSEEALPQKVPPEDLFITDDSLADLLNKPAGYAGCKAYWHQDFLIEAFVRGMTRGREQTWAK